MTLRALGHSSALDTGPGTMWGHSSRRACSWEQKKCLLHVREPRKLISRTRTETSCDHRDPSAAIIETRRLRMSCPRPSEQLLRAQLEPIRLTVSLWAAAASGQPGGARSLGQLVDVSAIDHATPRHDDVWDPRRAATPRSTTPLHFPRLRASCLERPAAKKNGDQSAAWLCARCNGVAWLRVASSYESADTRRT